METTDTQTTFTPYPHTNLHTSPPHIYPPPHIPTSTHTHLHTSPPHLPTYPPIHITYPPPTLFFIQYLLLWLRGRARAECPGLGRWRFRSLCLRMEGGVTVTGVQLAVFIHWELGGRESGLGGPTFDLSVPSSESLCWRVFWKSATRASLDRSCLSRSPISLLLDCSCTQRDSH